MTSQVPIMRRVGSSRWGVDEPTGTFALVDDEDLERVMVLAPWRRLTHGYAVSKQTVDGVRRTILLHRFVLGLHTGPSDVHVDHLNHDPMDNRKSNLSPGTQQDNNRNSSPTARSDSSSQYKGVGRYRKGWRAQGWENGKTKWLGAYDTEREAAAAYDDWKRYRA